MMRIVIGQHQHEAPRRALLALVLTGPVDLVAGRQLYLFVDLANGFFDGAAEVAVANAVFDGDVALTALAARSSSAPSSVLMVVSWAKETRSPRATEGGYCRWPPACIADTAGDSGRRRRSALRLAAPG